MCIFSLHIWFIQCQADEDDEDEKQHHIENELDLQLISHQQKLTCLM